MIRFILKGILRDKNRSVLPIIIISIGVALTVLLSGYMKGVFTDLIDQNARFDTGHVKVMTRAYADNIDQLPHDLALLEVNALIKKLESEIPRMQWVKRIRFGGLIDVPDASGESRGQGPTSGIALDLLNENSGEIQRMNIRNALVSGTIPDQQGEALIGHDFAQKLNVTLGDEMTYFGTTMNGSMTFQNFKVSGTIRFGAAMLDRGALIIDVADAQRMLDMEGGAAEVLGYFKDYHYDDQAGSQIAEQFNASFTNQEDEFAPLMLTLKQQNNLAELLDYSDKMSSILIFIFVAAMSVVLWNTGLLAGLRRYQEFGIRLALGEAKGTIYRRMIIEAVLIGIIGSVVGTMIGLAGVYYLQIVGFDVSQYMDNATMLMPAVMRAKVTPDLFYIGFIPGVLAMVLGNMLSGLGIYKRATASLFKELEV